jgi:hypothetical protein
MVSRGMLWIATGSLSVAAFGQTALRMAPTPLDPLEIVTGQIQAADSPADRETALQLLSRARNNYALRNASQGFDLKVSFTVNSGGQTDYDGAWKIEEISDPELGLRWTATASAGYTTTHISSKGMTFGAGTASTIPLRLHEARAALFDPIPALGALNRAVIRTSTATFNGTQVTCVLLSGSESAVAATPGRRWEETEECIDPQSGLLRVHSQVPGRYYAYDYSNAPRLRGYVMPRKVAVAEAGKIVSAISVDSLTELPTADPSLFVPTAEMKEAGRAVGMAGAQKISRVLGPGTFQAGATARAVCVFGLVTSSGQLVEAHSLQPSDPNSQAALEAVKQMNFSRPVLPGTGPQQHFVFVIEKFVSAQSTP